jgi:hypothetical protein
MGDRVQLQPVILNLLRNVTDASIPLSNCFPLFLPA